MTVPSAEDLRQIQNLLFDYGSTLDGGHWDEHLSLWIEDCEMFVFGRSFRGREAIDRFMRKATRGKHVTAVDIRRLDQRPDGFDVTYLLDIASTDDLMSLSKDLQGTHPGINITFLDQNGMPGI